MASLGRPAKDILPFPPATEADGFLKVLLQVLTQMEGDIDISQPFANVSATASQNVTGLGIIEPPQDQTNAEWIPLFISIVDTANTDAADRLALVYLDVPSQLNVQFYVSQGRTVVGTITNIGWEWPVYNNFNTNTTTLLGTFFGMRLFRKVGGDPFRRIRVDASTSGTVGTRNFTCRIAYLRRPSTRV